MSKIEQHTTITLEEGEHGHIDINPTAHGGTVVPIEGPVVIRIERVEETTL